MPKGKNADLTFSAEALYPNDNDSTMHVPPEAVTSLLSNLAARTGLTEDQIRLTLTALATIAQEQVCSHPNRYFLIPGIGALMAAHRPSQEKMNPFTKKVTSTGATISLRIKFANEMLESLRSSIVASYPGVSVRDE